MILIMGSFVFLQERKGRPDCGVCGEMHLWAQHPGEGRSRMESRSWENESTHRGRIALVFRGPSLSHLMMRKSCAITAAAWGLAAVIGADLSGDAILSVTLRYSHWSHRHVCGIKLCAPRDTLKNNAAHENNATRQRARVMRRRKEKFQSCGFDWRATWFFWHDHFYLFGLKVWCC